MAVLGPEVQGIRDRDKEMFEQASPKGRFSSKALNALVKAVNMLLPAFDQKNAYPKFDAGVYEVWPEDLVRIFSMFAAASKDAAAQEIVPSALVINLDDVADDNALYALAGQVQALSKSKHFKRWLKQPPEKEEVEPVEEQGQQEEMSPQVIDKLFESRL